MKLMELYAEEFGCLENRRFVLGEGLNIIEGANESGKSTLQALIRFLFYGFPRRAGEEGEECAKRISRRTRRAAGSVRFEHRGCTYALSRDLVLHTSGGRDLPTERVNVLREDGSAVELFGKTPGEHFFSLPAELFMASICVRDSEVDRVADPRMSGTVADALFFGEGTAPLARAERILDAARRELSHNRGGGGQIPSLRQELCELDESLRTSRRDLQRERAIDEEMVGLRSAVKEKETALDAILGMEEAAGLDAELQRYDAWHRAESEAAQLLARVKTEDPDSPHGCFLRFGGKDAVLKKVRRLSRAKCIFTPVSASFGVLTAVFAVLSAWKNVACWPLAAGSLALFVLTGLWARRAAKKGRALRTSFGAHSPAMLRTALARLEEERAQLDVAKNTATVFKEGLDPQREALLRARRNALPTPDADRLALGLRRQKLQEAARVLADRLLAAEREKTALAVGGADVQALTAQRAEVTCRLDAAEKRLLAIQMATEALAEGGESLRSGVIPRLSARASEMFSYLTNGVWRALLISDRFAVSVSTDKGPLPLSHFSAGCRDAAYLSLRLALAELLSAEPLPLFLDEVTVRLDDTRLTGLLSLLCRLASERRQCLLFTCHTREAALMQKMGKSAHLIVL